MPEHVPFVRTVFIPDTDQPHEASCRCGWDAEPVDSIVAAARSAHDHARTANGIESARELVIGDVIERASDGRRIVIDSVYEDCVGGTSEDGWLGAAVSHSNIGDDLPWRIFTGSDAPLPNVTTSDRSEQ